MVAPVVKPLSVGAGWVALSLYVESIFVSSVPAVIVFLTTVGPFVPIIAATVARRGVVSEQDVEYVYDPLYSEIKKNREQILSGKKNGQLPLFQKNDIDRIRLSARYSILKNQLPKVEDFCQTMDFISNNQGNVVTAITKIITGVVQEKPLLRSFDGVGISFSGKNTEGGDVNIPSSWMSYMILQDVDPLEYYRQHFNVMSMNTVDSKNNFIDSEPLPAREREYRVFWDKVKERAEASRTIKSMHAMFSRLPNLAGEAENQVLNKVKKSRGIFS